MKYFFMSDVHGEYNKMIAALNGAGFDKEKDVLVSLGDLFDRGPNSWEVLEYVMSCPNRILIWGNHDLRLKELMYGAAVGDHDKSNGVLETMRSFCDNNVLCDIRIGIIHFTTSDLHKDKYKMLRNYFNECCFAIEFPKLVATHAWIPVLVNTKDATFDKWGFPLSAPKYSYWENWRDACYEEWCSVVWSNSQNMLTNKIFIPNKTLVIGHWHAWRLRLQEGRYYDYDKVIDFSTYNYKNKLIALDGCSNATDGVVNVWVYESEVAPEII